MQGRIAVVVGEVEARHRSSNDQSWLGWSRLDLEDVCFLLSSQILTAVQHLRLLSNSSIKGVCARFVVSMRVALLLPAKLEVMMVGG